MNTDIEQADVFDFKAAKARQLLRDGDLDFQTALPLRSRELPHFGNALSEYLSAKADLTQKQRALENELMRVEMGDYT